MSQELNTKLHLYLTVLLAFVIPIYPKLIPFVIVILIINWLLGKHFTSLFRKSDLTITFLTIISLYIMYCIGLIYTDNMNYALKDLETKLSLIIFPMVYYTSPQFSVHNFQKIMKAFVWGCITAAAICFFHAAYQYFYTQYLISQNIWAWNYGINFFLKSRLSIWIHPSYLAMYCVFGLAVMYALNKENKFFTSIWFYFMMFILILFIFLLSSKAGLISLFILGAFLVTETIVKEKKIAVACTFFCSALFIFFSLYFLAPEFAGKVDEIISVLKGNTNKNSPGSTASRIEIWNSSVKVIKKNLLTGVGTGDIKDALIEQYRKDELNFAAEHKLNAHNQFLQTFASLGLPGFFLLVSGVLLSLIVSIKKGNVIHLMFVSFVIVNLLVESMFETQAGTVFISFFNSLFLFSQEEKI